MAGAAIISPPLIDGDLQPDPYEEGRLFHGPAFRYLTSLRLGPDGSSSLLDPSAGTVEQERLSPGLLDAALHGIPHEALDRWCPALGTDVVSYPRRLRLVRLYGPAPVAGWVRGEARFQGLSPGRGPLAGVELIVNDRVWASMLLEEVCLAKGPLGRLAPAQRIAFLRDRQFVAGAALSRWEDEATVLERRAVAQTDWLPGSLAAAYQLDPAADLGRQIAVKEHVARLRQVHPSAVRWDGADAAVVASSRHPVLVEEEGGRIIVRDRGDGR